MDYIVHGILQIRILEWVAISFSRGPYQNRGQTWVSALQVDSLPLEPPGKPLTLLRGQIKKWKKMQSGFGDIEVI